MIRPRWPGVVSIAFGALLLVGIAQSSLAHSAFVAAHPFNVAWIAIAVALATATFFAPLVGVRLGEIAPFLGLGGIGCLLAFVLQGLVNPMLARVAGPAPPGLGVFLLLGVGAAVCQTAGKWGAIAGLHLAIRPSSPSAVLALGLGVGLGFAGTEIVVIGQQTIGREAALVPPAFWSLWERASAGGFHVFSGGLIAVAVARRRPLWIAVVALLHSLLDGLAGAAGGGLVPLPLPALEVVFLLVAVATWLLYLRARRELEPGATRRGDVSLARAGG